ncbi:hypothetical protein [Pseudomonas sp. GM55]|uniref:hypothetical protein n=1 Tax=Pseudomonas sp. GM55 TaxID=1144333 RepID=UPI00068B9A13|nr:hypothetical protein [Pseudomonas sp. GM55]
MNHVPLGLISIFLLTPLALIEVWLIYIIHAYTEKAEDLLPKSSFVRTNKAAYSHAGFIGKAMRNGFLTMVLLLQGISIRKGILDTTEARDFPKHLKRILFTSWGLCWFFLFTSMAFGLYLRCTNQVSGS